MHTNDNTNAIGYVRMAVSDQASEKLNDQAQKITKYCEENNLNLLHIFKDNGASGLNFNRIGWNELKDELQKNNGSIKFLVVSDYDRISRNMFTAAQEIGRLKNDFGIEVCPAYASIAMKDMVKILHRLSNSSEKPRRNRRERH